MSISVAGFVRNGVVVPNAPLPEGAFMEVRVIHGPIEVPPELQAEFDAWDRADRSLTDDPEYNKGDSVTHGAEAEK